MVYNLLKIIYNVYYTIFVRFSMFGYIKCDKPEMKVKEYEVYKGLYCSLCKAMIKHFGILASVTLSYDIAFLVLMRLSFTSVVPDFRRGRCPFNPAKKCNYCNNGDDEFRYAAAVSMMMLYHKVKDNIADSPFYKRIAAYLILPYAYFKNKKAEKMYPEVGRLISEAMLRQAKNEKKSTSSPDEAAHESADVLGKILAFGLDDAAGSIYRFGYGTGKWVYLCDAADDLHDDLKNGGYNVFVNMLGLTKGEEPTQGDLLIIERCLNMSCAFAAESFEETKEKTLVPIVRNIIYSGTQNVMNNILKGTDKNERPL